MEEKYNNLRKNPFNNIDPIPFDITFDIHSEFFNEIVKNNYFKYFKIAIPIDLTRDLNLQKKLL